MPVDAQLRFTSVPASTLGGPFDVDRAGRELYALLSDSEDFAVGARLVDWWPLETMLLWAANYLAAAGRGELNEPAPVSEFHAYSRERRQQAESVAASETQRLAQARNLGGYLEEEADPTLAVFAALTQTQAFGVRNSPLKVVTGSALAGINAITPGIAFIVTDGSVAAAVISSAAGLFVTYMVIPSMRGVGAGLEEVLHSWVLRLGPKQDRKDRKKD